VNVLDLFSGIGGFSLGLERAGMRTVAFCELNEFCSAVLAKHWPSVPNLGDIRAVGPEQIAALETIDVVCGGYPCQPYSVAGFRLGSEDPRDMASQMLRVIEAAKPAWVIAENVEGHIDLGLDAVCDGLERQGYAVWPVGLPATARGLPTMEWHLWIVAAASSERLQRCREITVQALEDGAKEFQGSDPRGADRWHLPQARLCGVGERLPRRMDRLRALGNAVPPQFPELIGRAIMRCAT
jgi:DNA (cytosine-5)-methyltransferase 1